MFGTFIHNKKKCRNDCRLQATRKPSYGRWIAFGLAMQNNGLLNNVEKKMLEACIKQLIYLKNSPNSCVIILIMYVAQKETLLCFIKKIAVYVISLVNINLQKNKSSIFYNSGNLHTRKGNSKSGTTEIYF